MDFLAYDVLDQQRMFVPECPELKGNLAQFLQRFEVSRGRGQPGATLMSPYPTPAVPVTIPDTSVCPCPIPSLIHESPVVLSPSPFLSPHNPIPDPLVSQSLSPTPRCPHH